MKKSAFIFLTGILFLSTITTAQVPLQGGYALKFDGVNDYVDLGCPAATQIANNLTISAWIKPSVTTGWRDILTNQWKINQSGIILAINGATGQLHYAATGTNIDYVSRDPASNVLDGKWHHVAITFSSGTFATYLDGALIDTYNSGISAIKYDGGYSFLIGRDSGEGDEYFNGLIDEVCIWNVARTEAQIKTTMYKELSGSESGLIAYYKMNTGTGTSLIDNTASGITGNLTNGPQWKLSGCLGGSKNALDFDGSNDNITFGYSAALVITASVTLEAWVNLATTGQQCFVAGKIVHGSPQYGYGMYVNSGNLGGDPGQVTFIAGRSWSDWPSVRSNARLEANKWYHVAATFDGRYLKIYINGKLDNTYDRGYNYSMNDSGDNFKIGYNGNLGVNYFSGKIDEVRVWNTARTETQIRDNFLKTLAGNESGLAAYYRMDQFDGTILYDMTANGINGTLNNMDAATDWVSSGAFNTWIGSENELWTNADNWTNGAASNGQSLGFYNTDNGKAFSLNSTLTYNNIYLSNVNSLTLNTASQLTLNGNFFNNADVDIKSDISGDASLIVKGSVEGSGNFNAERYLSANQWHLVTSQITTGTAGVFQGIWLRPYLESTNTFGEYIVPTETPMPIGDGFSVWAPAAQTRTFTGTINNNAVTKSLQRSPDGGDVTHFGWNLVGNPYPCAIDLDAASGWTKNNVGRAVYVWDGNLGGGQYRVYLAATGTDQGIAANGGSRYIARGQGFFVQAIYFGATLTMDKPIRVHNAVEFRDNQAIPDMVNIQVTGNGYSDESIIYYKAEADDNFDFDYDAAKLYGSSAAPQLYTKKQNNLLTINAISNIDDLNGKQLFLEVGEQNEYVIKYTHSFDGYLPVLKDLFTDQNIYPGENYVFTANPEDVTARFEFFFGTTDLENQVQSAINIWEFENILRVEPKNGEEIQEIAVYSTQGQLIVKLTEREKDLSYLAPAVYIVKVTAGGMVTTDKIIIK